MSNYIGLIYTPAKIKNLHWYERVPPRGFKFFAVGTGIDLELKLGTNLITEEQLSHIKTLDNARAWINSGALEVITPSTTGLSSSYKIFNAANAIKLVSQTFNLKDLDSWGDGENRPTVLSAIASRRPEIEAFNKKWDYWQRSYDPTLTDEVLNAVVQ
ncbi:MAG TPA: hypothetical protein V6D14_24230 [Coleofasciculaceae cyanobacterium]|jgi:hypothetical protein